MDKEPDESHQESEGEDKAVHETDEGGDERGDAAAVEEASKDSFPSSDPPAW